MSKNFFLLTLISSVLFLGFIATSNLTINPSLNSQSVLGEENEQGKKAEEQAKEVEKKQEEIKKEGNKKETEVKTADGQKIKTKVEDDGTTKVEIEYGKLKAKYVWEDNELKLKTQNKEKELEVKKSVQKEIEDELEDDNIKISTESGKPILTKNNVGATSEFPLSIDVITKQLVVNTPAGQKVVTVLPDQALKNLLATGIINSLSSTAPSLDGIAKLEIKNDKLVYKVNGLKTRKILGFIPVTTDATAFVSADDGTTVATEQSFISNVVDLISP